MKKKLTKKNIGLGLLGLLILFQFFRIDKTNKVSAPEKDILKITNPAAQIASVLKNSCYDCHSNQVTYPWYTNIAPVSWWIKHHINEGTEHLNFSEWGDYAGRKADHKLKECVEMVEEGEMPMTSYTLIHSGSKLSKEQQACLISWFNSLRTHESDKPKENQ
jgi:hypothetical protein